MLRQEIRRFAEERILPGVRERDRGHTFPADLLREAGELGLLGMLVEERYGGTGFDPLSYCLAVEEISRISWRSISCSSVKEKSIATDDQLPFRIESAMTSFWISLVPS